MPEPLILCVDDEVVGLQVRQIVLEREGYRVLTAPDGPAALEVFKSEPIDLVVLDYFMPGMNGAEVAVEFRRLRPNIPILLLSAFINLPSEATRVVDSVLVKGDGPAVLLAKLREMLSRQTDTIDEEALG